MSPPSKKSAAFEISSPNCVIPQPAIETRSEFRFKIDAAASPALTDRL